jgi:CheY-like chemotaxis protein
MGETGPATLHRRRLLVVEDEYMIAFDLARSLEELGAEVIGPAPTVREALHLIASDTGALDGAVLDINLNGERAYAVAEALASRQVPFVFTTGYDAVVIPAAYAAVPRLNKPVDKAELSRLLTRSWARRAAG